jgi:hypothetical protein
MALSQISCTGNPVTKAYFARKVAEGKSKAQALVCLRRQMVNAVWALMKHRTPYRLPTQQDRSVILPTSLSSPKSPAGSNTVANHSLSTGGFLS